VFLHYFVKFEKVNLPRYIFNIFSPCKQRSNFYLYFDSLSLNTKTNHLTSAITYKQHHLSFERKTTHMVIEEGERDQGKEGGRVRAYYDFPITLWPQNFRLHVVFGLKIEMGKRWEKGEARKRERTRGGEKLFFLICKKMKNEWSKGKGTHTHTHIYTHTRTIITLIPFCHTPIFDLTSYIHTPSGPEYSLTF